MPVDFRYSSAFLRDVAGIAGVGLPGDRVADEAVEDERLVLQERVDHGGVRIRHQDHVRLLDLLEAADRRAVEPVALLEGVRRELVGGDREVLHQAREVAEAEVDDLDPLALDDPEDVCRCPVSHVSSSVRA